MPFLIITTDSMNILRLFHTVRFLRPSQVVWRFVFKLYNPRPDVSKAPEMRSARGQWELPACKIPSMTGPDIACFLNVERNISAPSIWNDPAIEKLWLYNLHYFDDLNAEGASSRRTWHEALINRWINDNPPASGNGWEPYPTSLRIVNWIKWILANPTPPPPAFLHSLAIQSRYLARRLEYHLLGNHLLANAKALFFAGLFFDGPEAKGWLRKSMVILNRQLPEQVLPDGGHFERSPMYHAIILEDLLDMLNLTRVFPGIVPESVTEEWRKVIQRMRRWLAVMTHPDGEISFFNDAAFGIASGGQALETYARQLGCANLSKPGCFTRLADSGYIRVEQKPAVALLDVAPVGPDYLPGHAHADTLSFELSLFGQRLIVNSGTSCYGTGPERLRQRGTASHNTVEIDGVNSSEVWSGFRVARRAYPQNLNVQEDANQIVVSCSHNGYKRLPGRPVHKRTWVFTPGKMRITDKVSGTYEIAQARFHLHPDVRCRLVSSTMAELVLADGTMVDLIISDGKIIVKKSTYHPEFGVSLENRCLSVAFVGELVTEVGFA